ncbi:MAG: hypothetical protein GXX84_17740 [Acidobacteria bacterium]|nr:hypothetical protein [Acidobacteriota bacterium]
MKHARFTMLSAVVVAALAAYVLAAANPPAEWELVTPQPVVGEKQRMGAFLNEKFGLTGGAGDIGKAQYTLDGGKTWAQADSSGG